MDIKKIIKNIKLCFSREACYEYSKEKGYLDADSCYGVIGGTEKTNYISETCVGCDHWEAVEYDLEGK